MKMPESMTIIRKCRGGTWVSIRWTCAQWGTIVQSQIDSITHLNNKVTTSKGFKNTVLRLILLLPTATPLIFVIGLNK